MAKKVRRRPDEEAEEKAFDFPVFDEASFVAKEFQLTSAVALATAVAALLGVFSWACTNAQLPWYVPFPVSFLLVLASPWYLERLLRGSKTFTRGDWAGLVFTEFFGFLAVWFVLVNVI